jgi:ComF family protein
MKTLRAVLKQGFDAIIDAILPPKERAVRIKTLSLEAIPLIPTTHDLLGTRIVTLMDYRTQEVQDLIQSLKYDGGHAAANLCAATLAEYLREELSNERLFSQKRVLLVPVPLHSSRTRERGYNQIGLVLESLPMEFRDGTHARLAPAVLERSRATRPQTRLPRSERLSNVAGAFALPDGADIKNARIFLIDDVATTGATLANAATPLRRAGAEVTLLALARA